MGKIRLLFSCIDVASAQVIKSQVFVAAEFVLIAVELNWECFLNVVRKRHFATT